MLNRFEIHYLNFNAGHFETHVSTHLKQDLGCNEGKAVQGGHQNAKTPNPHNPN